MSLGLLAKARAEAVETARLQLAESRRELALCEAAVRSLREQLASVDDQARDLRDRSAALATVASLRAAAGLTRAQRVSQRTLLARLRARVTDCATLRERVQQRERAVSEAELARKSVESVLSRRVRADTRRSELAEEEASEDATRRR